MTWETFFTLTGLIKDSALHFLLSGLAAGLVFSLIATISYGVCLAWSGTAPQSIAANIFILGLAFACAYVAAFSAHCWLDGMLAWWTTPLTAPLVIQTTPHPELWLTPFPIPTATPIP